MQSNLHWQKAYQLLPTDAGRERSVGEWDYRGGMRELLGVIEMIIILIVMAASQEHTYAKNYQVVHFQYTQLCQLHCFRVI